MTAEIIELPNSDQPRGEFGEQLEKVALLLQERARAKGKDRSLLFCRRALLQALRDSRLAATRD